jgi:hypothetical protein
LKALVKQHPFRRKSIDVGCVCLPAVTTEVTERAIISDDEQEVGPRFNRVKCAAEQDDKQ